MKSHEKLKLVRTTNNMTQAAFAEAIGISRGNYSGIEIGKVQPTPMLINCVSLMFNVDKKWLLDESDNDLSALNNSANVMSLLMDKYEQLEPAYKKFVEKQVNELLRIQGNDKMELT